MSLIRWSPMRSWLSNWPEMWDEEELPVIRSTTHDLDVYETDDEVIVRANVAGLAPEQVEVTFEKGVLWIRGQKQVEKGTPHTKHYSQASWNYSYRVAVPGLIDYNQEPQAEVEHGVITVTFKKAEASKPKKVQVKAKALKTA